MIRVALTGNIGSGKTTVSSIFKVLGVKVFNADLVAKNLYSDQSVINILTKAFSKVILNVEGEIDKKKLANIIFNNKQSLLKINSIIHPLVLSAYNDWCIEHGSEKYTIHESAILFENNLQDKFDYIINVVSPINTRINRVIKRDNISKETVLERINNQMTDEEKSGLSQFVVLNDDHDFLIPQVLKINDTLLSQTT